MKATFIYKGSSKSGNYGHAGIPGHQGGSQGKGSGGSDSILPSIKAVKDPVTGHFYDAKGNNVSHLLDRVELVESHPKQETRDAPFKVLSETRRTLTHISSGLENNMTYDKLQNTRQDLTHLSRNLARVNHPEARKFEARVDAIRKKIFDLSYSTDKQAVADFAQGIVGEIDTMRNDLMAIT